MGDNDTTTTDAPTRREYVKFGGAVVGGTLLAGCAGQSDSGSTPTETEANESSATDTSTPEGESYSVTMSPMGTVEFNSVPETAVSFDDQWADMLVALGQDDRLIAHGRPGNIITEFYDQLPNVSFDSEELTTLNDNMSVETFFELDADVHHLDPLRLAATWDGFEESDVETVRDQISPYFANRYSAYRNYTGDESYQYYSIWELTRKFADLYQVPDRAAALEEVYDEMVAEIQSNLPPESERPRVALSVHADGTFYGQPSITNPGFARAHIRPLQPRNAFAEYPQYEGFGVQYDMEAMVEVDPDVFIQALGLQFPDRIPPIRNPEDGSVAAEVTAFSNGRVYNGATGYQGPLYTLFQTEMTAKQIYPEQFGEWRGLGNTPESEQLFDRQRVADIINGEI
jgi:ABC-type Fe3+-hydroxamate transport system substrate-binding protein